MTRWETTAWLGIGGLIGMALWLGLLCAMDPDAVNVALDRVTCWYTDCP